MTKSIAVRAIILVLGLVLLVGTRVAFAEESAATSGWSTPKEAAPTQQKDYEIVIIEPEKVPLTEGPAALQKFCVLHYALLAVAVILYFVLRVRAIRIEKENEELERLLNDHCEATEVKA